jgi:hypothetical protein
MNTTPRMMVLGLVIQEADTVSGVGRRLTDNFKSAGWSKGSAKKNLPSLAKEGKVRLVEKGLEPPLDRYEATPYGIDFFRGWLRRAQMPPEIRDAVQGKLEFLGQEDLAALVEAVTKEREAYTSAAGLAHGRLLEEQEIRRRVRARKKPVPYEVRLRCIQYKDEATLLRLMAQRLEHLCEDIEELRGEIIADESALDG